MTVGFLDGLRPSTRVRRYQARRIAQIALDCTDLERATSFYEDCLGLERVAHVPGLLAFFEDPFGNKLCFVANGTLFTVGLLD